MDSVVPIDEEFFFNDDTIISQTDLKGVITFANRQFCKVSGYTSEELIGQAHNIIRHPSMPKVAFEKMWDTIKSGHTWNGIVQNLRKDGLYYWVDTEILPIENKNHEITGYIAARKAASRKDIQEAQEIYIKMYKDQK
ncbi:MAG: PAS domain S-box protein [Sulfurimonas sp.]|nr:PAS domain S-box protein [Sulfurimonas sp.]